jgi:predicted ribosome quality control (RQC) complex YloA/Tae2 family protein
MEKEVENCAYCIDYECEKLAKFLEQAPKAKKTLEKIRQQKIEQK